MITRLIGVALAVAALVLTVLGSHATLPAFAESDSVVRVSWSARPERIEVCRRVPDEELKELAEHMRRRVVCEGTTARYRLEVLRNGVPIDTATVRGGGLRHDRELYVARELAVAPGSWRLAVRFVRIDSSVTAGGGEDAGGGAREDDERRRRRAEAIPPALAIDTTIVMAPRAVVLVTYDANGRRLVAKDRR